MLPRLRADEAMATATQVAAGSGQLQPHSRREVWDAWEQAAAAQPTTPAPKRATLEKRHVEGAHGMKLTLVREKPKGQA